MKRSTRSTNNLKQSENEDNSRPNQGVEGFEKCLWPLCEYQQYDSVMVSHYRTVHKVEDIPKFRLNHDREKWYEEVKGGRRQEEGRGGREKGQAGRRGRDEPRLLHSGGLVVRKLHSARHPATAGAAPGPRSPTTE